MNYNWHCTHVKKCVCLVGNTRPKGLFVIHTFIYKCSNIWKINLQQKLFVSVYIYICEWVCMCVCVALQLRFASAVCTLSLQMTLGPPLSVWDSFQEWQACDEHVIVQPSAQTLADCSQNKTQAMAQWYHMLKTMFTWKMHSLMKDDS